MAFALTRRFQNLPKIEGVGFLSVSRRERLLGDREMHPEPPFKYCSQPSVPQRVKRKKNTVGGSVIPFLLVVWRRNQVWREETLHQYGYPIDHL